MGLFSKRQTTIVTDIATWPEFNDTQQAAVNMVTMEKLRNCMPAEWYPQRAVQITWPDELTDWEPYLQEVTDCYLRIAYEISVSQKLIITCRDKERVEVLLKEKFPQKALDNIILVECPINDTWVRDYGFITIVEDGKYKLLDFRFNGWGDKFDAQNDNDVNKALYATGLLDGEYHDDQDFVFEGGSIESDGQGTLLTTSQCLLNPNRNPHLSKGDIEHLLLTRLKAQRLLWLDYGYLSGDDTDSHVDTLARLCPDNTIVYVQCTDKDDEHYAELKRMEEQLQSFVTTDGKSYHLLPLPMAPVLYDEDGMRLPSTYANYLVINRRVLMPTYGDAELDDRAVAVLESAFPGYSVTGIDCRVLVKQHGSLHCSTMQYY